MKNNTNNISLLNHIYRGCGYLPTCGSHPCNTILIIMIACGFIAGGLIGAGIMGIFFGPIYLFGAYMRSKCDLENR